MRSLSVAARGQQSAALEVAKRVKLVAPMSASSFGRDAPDRITLGFEPFAAPAIAPGWSGRMLRMQEVIISDGPSHEMKDQ